MFCVWFLVSSGPAALSQSGWCEERCRLRLFLELHCVDVSLLSWHGDECVSVRRHTAFRSVRVTYEAALTYGSKVTQGSRQTQKTITVNAWRSACSSFDQMTQINIKTPPFRKMRWHLQVDVLVKAFRSLWTSSLFSCHGVKSLLKLKCLSLTGADSWSSDTSFNYSTGIFSFTAFQSRSWFVFLRVSSGRCLDVHGQGQRD